MACSGFLVEGHLHRAGSDWPGLTCQNLSGYRARLLWVAAECIQGLSIERVKKVHIDFTDNQKYL